MIQHAFSSAYSNQVSQQNQGISNITRGVKDAATLAVGVAGFASGSEGIAATAAEHTLAGRVGGVGGNIMLATLKEKEAAAKAREQQKTKFTAEEITSQLSDNPINRPALKQLNTVFDTLMKAKEEKMLDKKGQLDTSLGKIDPKSELGKRILGGGD